MVLNQEQLKEQILGKSLFWGMLRFREPKNTQEGLWGMGA